MVQEGLKKGILVTWTKSFACTDGVGEDAVRLLEEAISRRGVRYFDVGDADVMLPLRRYSPLCYHNNAYITLPWRRYVMMGAIACCCLVYLETLCCACYHGDDWLTAVT